MIRSTSLVFFFFFKAAATTGIYSLSLHDALPICDIVAGVLSVARISLLVGLIVVGISATVGIAVGSVAGYFGGRIDEANSRLIDILLDRKSTRLNSSDTSSSYAAFCLKKKNHANTSPTSTNDPDKY